jgi:hypothetical protein
MSILKPGDTPSVSWTKPEAGHLNPVGGYYIYYIFADSNQAPVSGEDLKKWTK